VTGSHDRTVKVWDLAHGGTCERTISAGVRPNRPMFSASICSFRGHSRPATTFLFLPTATCWRQRISALISSRLLASVSSELTTTRSQVLVAQNRRGHARMHRFAISRLPSFSSAMPGAAQTCTRSRPPALSSPETARRSSQTRATTRSRFTSLSLLCRRLLLVTSVAHCCAADHRHPHVESAQHFAWHTERCVAVVVVIAVAQLASCPVQFRSRRA
jgi:hypothetical protein